MKHHSDMLFLELKEDRRGKDKDNIHLQETQIPTPSYHRPLETPLRHFK